MNIIKRALTGSAGTNVSAFRGHTHPNKGDVAQSNTPDQLTSCREKCPLDNNYFIPAECISQLITPDNVRAELTRKSTYPADLSRYNIREADFFDYIRISASKLYIVLACLDIHQHIFKFCNARFTDKHLRYDQNTLFSIVHMQDKNSKVEGSKIIKKALEQANLTTIANLEKFCAYQWQVLAPVFETWPKRHKLFGNTPLPVVSATIQGVGGFSVVWIAEIHPSHRPKGSTDGARKCVKQLKQSGLASPDTILNMYDNEANMLKEFAQHPHDHIIRYEAAIQRGDEWFFVFPWAEHGNLRDFWKRDVNHSTDPSTLLWLVGQLTQLCGALQFIHSRKIRHTDLKPENILVFPKEGTLGDLVIADVGLARKHILDTHERHGSGMISGTEKYAHPEKLEEDNGEIGRSRVYDTWSMGCILLEAIIWFLWGRSGWMSFTDSLPALSPFWTRNGIKDGKSFRLVDEVADALAWLRKHDARCAHGTVMRDLLNLVEQKLLVEQRARSQAEELHGCMKAITALLQQNKHYQASSAREPARGLKFRLTTNTINGHLAAPGSMQSSGQSTLSGPRSTHREGRHGASDFPAHEEMF